MSNIFISNPEQFRKNIAEQLDKKIQHKRRSHNLEVSIYNYCIRKATNKKILRKWNNKYFVNLYIDRLRSIMNNLNDYMLDLIQQKVIKTRQIGEMSFYEMNPIKWTKLVELKKIRDKNKFENTAQKVVSLFICKKCRGRNCTNTPIQTRSCDEGITNFITCMDCGCNWKMSS